MTATHDARLDPENNAPPSVGPTMNASVRAASLHAMKLGSCSFVATSARYALTTGLAPANAPARTRSPRNCISDPSRATHAACAINPPPLCVAGDDDGFAADAIAEAGPREQGEEHPEGVRAGEVAHLGGVQGEVRDEARGDGARHREPEQVQEHRQHHARDGGGVRAGFVRGGVGGDVQEAAAAARGRGGKERRVGATTRRGRRERGRGTTDRPTTMDRHPRGDRNVPRADRPAETARVPRGARASAGARGDAAGSSGAPARANRTRTPSRTRGRASVGSSESSFRVPRSMVPAAGSSPHHADDDTERALPGRPRRHFLWRLPRGTLAPPRHSVARPLRRSPCPRARSRPPPARRACTPGSRTRRLASRAARARPPPPPPPPARPCSITSRSRWRRARASTCTTSRPRSSRS